MKSNVLFFFLTLLIFSVNNTNAQHFMRGVCGVHAHEMEMMDELYPNDGKGQEPADRNAIIHIPIQFHIVGTDAGTGRVPPHLVLRQLCILNRDFANTNFRFYLNDDFNYINSTAIYSSPSSNGNLIQARKVARAVNVFITDKADATGSLGTVLGYYSPQGDYVILTRNEVVKLTNTLSHEVGHFFNLRHTFHGWESDPWNLAKHNDTLQFRFTQSNFEIEYVSRTNCTTAADQLCDTPPDYNFGFTSNGCNYTYQVWDFNKERVIPQKENQMSYFSNCPEFVFTPNQGGRMTSNYNSSGRSFLRNNPLPNLDTIVGPVSIITPQNAEQLNVFDGVLIDWEDVPNATHYVLEIRYVSATEYLVLDKSEFYATQLRKNTNYIIEITPFSYGHFCATSTTRSFRTGSQSITASDDLVNGIKWSVYPNPVSLGMPVLLQTDQSESAHMTLSLTDAKGQIVKKTIQEVASGKQIVRLETDQITSGLYFLHAQTDKLSRTFKISIQ